MDKVVLSIVIPCYNVEKYLEECVKSVLDQHFTGLEIILVEDSSTDNTFEMCKRIETLYDNVFLLRHSSNRGLEETRNDGISVSRGKWVMFLDGDDTIQSGALESFEGLFECDLDIVLSRFLYFDSFTAHESLCGLVDGQVYSSKDIGNFIGDKLSWEMISCAGNKIYRRSFLEENALEFEREYLFNEDGAFSIKSFMAAQRIKYVDTVLYRYRKNYGGIMCGYRKNAFASLDKVNKLLGVFFEQCGCVAEKNDFLNRKRLDNLIDSFNSEIQYGSRNEFRTQFDNIVSDNVIMDWIRNSLEQGGLTTTERNYADAIVRKDEERVIAYAKSFALEKVYKQWLYKIKSDKNYFSGIAGNRLLRIGIYGAGEIGRLLAAEIEQTGSSVLFFLDRSEMSVINHHIPCYDPEETIPESDLLINTVVSWNEDIVRYITERTKTPIISLWELLS